MQIHTFGDFIKCKRTEKNFSLRGFSKLVGISPVYASNVENGSRSAPNPNVLEQIRRVLVLNEQESEELYELAALTKKRDTIAPDLMLYINDNQKVHEALRLAKRINADEDDWQFFVKYLSEKPDVSEKHIHNYGRGVAAE